ncbi:kinase-like domain-containing protein [Xylogone sp. PMI_703]|nr:kinase-like domain-containing protein [Xylogone sp. PMI_703]
MMTDFESEESFFVKLAKSLPAPRCYSLAVRNKLITEAVKKNGSSRDERDENLLFPPSIIQKVLVHDTVARILSCKCVMCHSMVRETLADKQLTNFVTAEGGEALRCRFAALTFMGAGFAARHICSFPTFDDAQQSESSVKIFELLKVSLNDRVSTSSEISEGFWTSLPKVRRLFESPTIQIGSHLTNFTGKTLPFLKQQHLNNDRSSFGTVFAFEIHKEFRGPNVPARAVRKEVHGTTSNEELRTLEFLAECAKPNFIQLLFWYIYDDKINYVFPEYPGSLQKLLNGDMSNLIRPLERPKYGQLLSNSLWQGMMDIIQALKFFHYPEQDIVNGPIIAAHFDMKPANILVDNSGTLIITDFGQARIRRFNAVEGSALTAQVGDLNYRPPLSAHGIPPDISETKWSRAYDVWSMACIMTEVIEFLIQTRFNGYKSFRERRLQEDRTSAAFWTTTPAGRQVLRNSVRETLNRFRGLQDRYLSMVADILETMFCIDPIERPTMSDCLAILSEDMPADEWPLREEGEISICGLGTNSRLRNMHTQFKRNYGNEMCRCKMYLLLNHQTSKKRIRLAIEFKRAVPSASTQEETGWILSDSKEYKPLSLFDPKYEPNKGKSFQCAFRVVHPNLTFIFDHPIRAPSDYFRFLAASTRQMCLRPHVHMPIEKCSVRFSTWKDKRKEYRPGHIQIWKQLSDDDYHNNFTDLISRRSSERSSSLASKALNDLIAAQTTPNKSATGWSKGSISSASSGTTLNNNGSQSNIIPHRLVIFISEPPGRCLTINLTNRYNRIDIGLDPKKNKSSLCITFRAVNSNFRIGNWIDDSCPGIPLDPELMQERESHQVDWVEIHFKDMKAMASFENLWSALFPQ